MEPNRERIRLWVEWLRTKGLLQARGALAHRRGDSERPGEWGYCCLGVGCEVAIASGLNVQVRIGIDGQQPWTKEWKAYDGAIETLPDSVAQWLGLPNSDPIVSWGEQSVAQHLSTLNDQERWNFNRIADAIEYTFLREEGDETTGEDQTSDSPSQ